MKEYATISHGQTVYRISFADRDLIVSGVIYTATAAKLGEIGPEATGQQKDCTITLPIDHAFVRRYMQQGIPPGKITVLAKRQLDDSSVEQRWSGEIDGVSVDDKCTEATFKIVSTMARVGLRTVPSIVVSRECPHTVFEGLCGRGISRSGTNPDGHAYRTSTTVLAVAGREVRFDMTNVPAAYVRRKKWCVNGEFVHLASSERRTIREQRDESAGSSTITWVSLHVPIVELKVGDLIEVYPGCDHEIRGDYGCNLMFGNRQNFGGVPALPDTDPFTPGQLL